jgi:GH43 family beta-xylosidase
VFQQAAGIYGPAHNGFFKSPDSSEDWIVYHANSNAADGCWTRGTTRVRRFDWNADGTPNFGTPLPLATDVRVPSGE